MPLRLGIGDHRSLSLDSATSPTSPLSRAGSTKANFSSPLSQLRHKVEAHRTDNPPAPTMNSPAKVESDKKQSTQRRQRTRKLSGTGPERNKPLPLTPFEPLVFRTPYRNRSARVRPSSVQSAVVTPPNQHSSTVRSQVASVSGDSNVDGNDTSRPTEARARVDRSSISCASSLSEASYVTAPPLSRVWSSPDIQWPAARTVSDYPKPMEDENDYDYNYQKPKPLREPPSTKVHAPTPISPRHGSLPGPCNTQSSAAPRRRGKAICRLPSPAARGDAEQEPAQKHRTIAAPSLFRAVDQARSMSAAVGSGSGSTLANPKPREPPATTSSPQPIHTSLHMTPLPPTPPSSHPSPQPSSSRRHSDTFASPPTGSALKAARPRSTPLLEATYSPSASAGPSVSAWAAACQAATYFHVLLRASAFTQHMHDRNVKSPTVLAMLAFLHASPEDPQELCTLLWRLGKALHEDKIVSSEQGGSSLLERLLAHFAREKGFNRLFTATYSARTTCASCAKDVFIKQNLGWSAPSIHGDSVCSLRFSQAWCTICGRTTKQVTRSVPAVHAPLLLVEPATSEAHRRSGVAGSDRAEITYLIKARMVDRAAGKEWKLVGAVIPVFEGQLGFVATVDGVMTLFKGKHRMAINLAYPVPTPVFVLYER